ncbi:proteasome assembly chaperone 2 isoform X1 [Pangasianodon hypophthalmus]|uniref:proteasome assembly chaperone 2 isoform X1 n=1 Tax=Pangasianodon hypophthalmus TaxID=310915 RepID=UPI00147F4A7F|nr:proteasome assembly chaperone 2 isoform X1 [Pangasianodon hypophthalmus]
MFVSAEARAPCFKGFTLITPAVSVGNVGQLAADLIISTLDMVRAGHFHTDCLIPMAGNNPYSSGEEDAALLSTNAEVYCRSDLQLAVLQIRTPILPTKMKSFRKTLVSWIKTSGFSRTVLLSSCHAHHRDDQQLLSSSPLRYLLTPALRGDTEGTEGTLQSLGWREMERVSAFPGVTDSDRQRLYIPGGGITKALYNDCCSENMSMAVLLLFCSEGDNIPDAFTLVNHLNDWLHLLDKPVQGSVPWRSPSSWRLLFGSGVPPMIF